MILTGKSTLEKYDDISYRAQVDKNVKEYNYESFISHGPTLREHLLSQLSLISLENKEYKIGENIIYNIDENGYLTTSIEDIAKFMKSNIEEVKILLDIIQAFDPVGVGARDLKECLLIQLRDRKDVQVPVLKQ